MWGLCCILFIFDVILEYCKTIKNQVLSKMNLKAKINRVFHEKGNRTIECYEGNKFYKRRNVKFVVESKNSTLF
jgi:hypothetical protein